MGVYVTVIEEGRGERKRVKVCDTEEQLQIITVRQLKQKIKLEFGLTHPDYRVDLTFEGKKLEDHQCLSYYGIRHGSTIFFTRRRSMDRPPSDGFRLVFVGKELDDDQYLSDCGVQHGSNLHMVLRLRRAERPQRSAATADHRTDGHKMGVHVFVKTLTGEEKVVEVCETVEQIQSIKIWQLKEKIKQEFGLPPEDFRLVFRDKVLEDDETLSSYGVQHKSHVHMIFKLRTAERSPQSTERPQKGVQVFVIGPRGKKCQVKVCETVEQLQSIKIWQLKEKIKQEFGLPPDDIILVFVDKRLKDDDETLSHYGIQHESVILMAIRMKGGEGLPPEHQGGGEGYKHGRRRSMDEHDNFRDDGSGAAGGSSCSHQ